MDDLKTKLINEARRVEEDCEHSAKGHYNAAERWTKYHLWIGLPSAILGGLAGASAFENMNEIAGILAVLSTALISVLTFLKPSQRAENHKAVASQYLSLRNKSRLYREIETMDIENIEYAKKRLISLADQRDEYNQSSPSIARKDYELAKKDIDEGRSTYKFDGGGK